MKISMTLVAAALALAAVSAAPQAASAAGCVKGAIVGGVAGHYTAHHGLLGAGIGCAWGHHEATKREREQMREDRYDYGR